MNNYDNATMNKLFEENIKLIYFVINKLNYKMDRDDQFQCGGMGLMYAIRHYDESLGYAFSTYATAAIKYFILKEYKKELEYYKHTISLDAPISTNTNNDDNDQTLSDIIPDNNDQYDLVLTSDAIDNIISQLPEIDRTILDLRYYQNMTIDEVAKHLNKNPEFIKRLEHTALQHCRVFINKTKDECQYDLGGYTKYIPY